MYECLSSVGIYSVYNTDNDISRFWYLAKVVSNRDHSRRSTKYNNTFKISMTETGFNPDSQKVIHDFLLYGQIIEDSLTYYVLSVLFL